MRNFSEDAEFWLLFCELGGDFGSRACRSFARRHQLQTSAALLQYFEARMSHGHYMLIKLTDDGVPAGQKLQIAEAFHDIPVHCFSFLGRRIKMHCPSAGALVGSAHLCVTPWAESVFLAIDSTERSHATMRLDARSTTVARNFTQTSNRVMCQQLGAEHRRRDGEVPCLKHWQAQGPPSPNDGQSAQALPLVACGDEPTPKLRKRSGMNLYLEYLNHKFATFKSLSAPGRDLSQDERGKVLQKCERDWVAMSDVSKRPWSMVYKSAANLRVLCPIVEACPFSDEEAFPCSVAGSSQCEQARHHPPGCNPHGVQCEN